RLALVVRGREIVLRARAVRTDHHDLSGAGIEAFVDGLRAGPNVDLADDVLKPEIDREHELAGLGVDRLVDADLAGRQRQLAIAAVDRQLDDLALEGPVEIPLIVREMLERPYELTRRGIDCERRVRVERVVRHTGLVDRLEERTRIVRVARAEIREPRLRIIAARGPDRRAGARLVRHAVPAVAARLARLRNRADPPQHLARLRVEADDLRAP